jgi:transposase
MPTPGLRPALRGLPPFAPPSVWYTYRLQALVESLWGMRTAADWAEFTGLGWDTVKNIIKARLEKDHGPPRRKRLRNLSRDEICFGRHKKFHTLVLDLDSGPIVWGAKGRGGEALRPFWRAWRANRAEIEAVAMDMRAAYWAAVMEHLPEAAIVSDRFHLMKLMNEKLDDLRRQMVNEATGRMKQTVKGIRYLLLLRREHMDEEELPRLDEALTHNEPLFAGCPLKEAWGLLWEQPPSGQMRSFLSEWCDWADPSGLRQMRQMARTLPSHKSGILAWWKHRINNGRMEGTNNKIKTLLRPTCGRRDERYLILRLLSLHKSRQELLG